MLRMLVTVLAASLSSLLGAQVITITFEAELNGVPEPLDSILVLNLDQGGDTTLYFPDDQLVLGSTGIVGTELPPIALLGLPNPFAESTEVLVGASGDTDLLVEVHDATGRQVATLSLPAGGTSHRIAFTSGRPGMHVLSVTGAGTRSSLRLMATEGGAAGYGLNYLGQGPQRGKPKGGGGFFWTAGDALRCVGYAADMTGSLSGFVELVPTMNTTETFQLDRGLVCPLSPTVTDIDGNTYTTVQIGDQCWMRENLNVTTYGDGFAISNITTAFIWTQTNSGAWCDHDNDPANGSTYGKLYNLRAVELDSLIGLCPLGWHVPSDAEWKELELSLGMLPADVNNSGVRGIAQQVGGQMKSLLLWDPPNTSASNASGFSALPGGWRKAVDGTFDGLGIRAFWWSRTPTGPDDAWYRFIGYTMSGIERVPMDRRNGYSVRCVRDQ